jgi:hypothetical protein
MISYSYGFDLSLAAFWRGLITQQAAGASQQVCAERILAP